MVLYLSCQDERIMLGFPPMMFPGPRGHKKPKDFPLKTWRPWGTSWHTTCIKFDKGCVYKTCPLLEPVLPISVLVRVTLSQAAFLLSNFSLLCLENRKLIFYVSAAKLAPRGRKTNADPVAGRGGQAAPTLQTWLSRISRAPSPFRDRPMMELVHQGRNMAPGCQWWWSCLSIIGCNRA